jgi:hypothetical protein
MHHPLLSKMFLEPRDWVLRRRRILRAVIGKFGDAIVSILNIMAIGDVINMVKRSYNQGQLCGL